MEQGRNMESLLCRDDTHKVAYKLPTPPSLPFPTVCRLQLPFSGSACTLFPLFCLSLTCSGNIPAGSRTPLHPSPPPFQPYVGSLGSHCKAAAAFFWQCVQPVPPFLSVAALLWQYASRLSYTSAPFPPFPTIRRQSRQSLQGCSCLFLAVRAACSPFSVCRCPVLVLAICQQAAVHLCTLPPPFQPYVGSLGSHCKAAAAFFWQCVQPVPPFLSVAALSRKAANQGLYENI